MLLFTEVFAFIIIGRHDNIVWNPTPSIDAYSPEEESCQFSSRSDLKRRSLI